MKVVLRVKQPTGTRANNSASTKIESQGVKRPSPTKSREWLDTVTSFLVLIKKTADPYVEFKALAAGTLSVVEICRKVTILRVTRFTCF